MIFDIVQFYLFLFFLIFPHIACPDLPSPLKNFLGRFLSLDQTIKSTDSVICPYRIPFRKTTREILPPPGFPGKKTSAKVGIIDEELVKNLAICGAVILVVIFALVPNPRIAIWVPAKKMWEVEACGWRMVVMRCVINQRDSRYWYHL